MRIVHIAAEMAPLAKVGGLGDIVGGLSLEMAKEGHEVEVILPKYNFLNLKNHHVEYQNVQSYENQRKHSNSVLKIKYEGITLSLIEPNKEISYYNRPNIYGYPDDTQRFIYLCRAALEYLLEKNEPIDILHIHDWHTSLCAVLYKDLFQNLGLKINKIVLNIHNLKYQGICSAKYLDLIGLSSKKYKTSPNTNQKSFPINKINLLKAGITYSDAVVTVSPTYAQEMLTKEYGYGLDHILRENKHKLHGILNGIDENIWNPETDPLINHNYSVNDPIEKIIRDKENNKVFLRELLQLEQTDKPLVGNIGRLVPQKGPKLIEKAMFSTLKNNGQFVLLGSSMIKSIQKRFSKLEKSYKNDNNLSINFAYNEPLAHLIYAACDFIIVPSLFEPCGLTQIVAMKYGTIPIVRNTGGLADTVFDIDDPSLSSRATNGFIFEKFNETACEKTLIRALSYWHNQKDKLSLLIQNAMKKDHRLKTTVQKYLDLYSNLLNS